MSTSWKDKLKRIPLGLFLVLFVLDILALVFDKIATNNCGVAVGDELGFYWRLLQQPFAWLGVGLGPFQLIVWSSILKKVDLSIAYPISSLACPLTMLAAAILLREQMTPSLWIGAILITAGVSIVGSAKHSDE